MTPDQIEQFRRIIRPRATEELEQMQTAIQEILAIRKEIRVKTQIDEEKRLKNTPKFDA